MFLVSGTSLSHSPARECVFLALDYANRNDVCTIFDLDFRNDTWNSIDEASVYYSIAALKSSIVIGTREEFNIMEKLYFKNNNDDDISAKFLLDNGVKIVSIKNGKSGSKIYTKDKFYHGGIYEVNALKTFGAGDAYSAAFNYGILKGFDIDLSLKYAAATAAITISGHSCSDSTPTLKELEDFMKKNVYKN